MPTKPNPVEFSSQFARIAEQLACPACHAELRLEPARLVCTACAAAYPIVDEIPILIPSQPQQ